VGREGRDPPARRLDEEARQAIQRESFNVGLGTAVSPYGFVDAILVCWRNVRLIRHIAEVYQVRPGAYGTWLILKRVVVAVALADLAQEASTAFLGAFRGIASLISPVGQGLTNAALTIRLGLLAQRECRPLPCRGQAQEPGQPAHRVGLAADQTNLAEPGQKGE